jgi:hypothetical protein
MALAATCQLRFADVRPQAMSKQTTRTLIDELASNFLCAVATMAAILLGAAVVAPVMR